MNSLVQALLDLPEPDFRDLGQVDYGAIAKAADDLLEILFNDEVLDRLDDGQWRHVRIHAWRALGSRGEMRFFDPFLSLLQVAEIEDDDWYGEDFIRIMAKIGVDAVPPLLAIFFDSSQPESIRSSVVMALDALCVGSEEVADTILDAYSRFLDEGHRTRSINGFLIASLIEMGAVHHAAAIRKAYEQNRVDLSINGDLEEVEVALGFREQRESERPDWRVLEEELNHKARLEELGPRPDPRQPVDVVSYFLALYGSDRSMLSASQVDGFLLACVCAPNFFPPSRWIPSIWDVGGDPDAGPVWHSMDEAGEFNSALMMLYNRNSDTVRNPGETFAPVTCRVDVGSGPQDAFSDWALGIMLGLDMWDVSRADTAVLVEELTEELSKIFAAEAGEFESDVTIPNVTQAFGLLEELFHEHRDPPFGLPGAAGPEPLRREAPKIGRNDPCPCGSGKKYKRCCIN